jgi:GNAT superfamily N-acetyltransferase
LQRDLIDQAANLLGKNRSDFMLEAACERAQAVRAVDQRAQGIKLGAGLLQDAVNRAGSVAQNAGVRALVVHALNEKARAFYEYYGFSISPIHPLTLMLSLN